MKLTEYPTPLTDENAETERLDGSPFAPLRSIVHADFARDLERKLDKCREALFIIACADIGQAEMTKIATNALTETAP